VLLEKNDKGVIFGSVENSTSPFSPQEEIYQALMLGLRVITSAKTIFPES
jgi:hypothetical protein